MDSTIFVRQRRNLILISFTLLISLLGHVLVKRINILGNEFPIEQTIRASVILWPLWIYWFFRYFQAFMEEGRGKLVDAYRSRFNEGLGKKAAQRLNPDNYDGFKTPVMKEVGAQLLARTLTRTESTPEGQEYLFNLEAANRIRESSTGLGQIRFKFSNSEIRAVRFKTLVAITFVTTAITEYVLPFLIAAAPVVCLPFV